MLYRLQELLVFWNSWREKSVNRKIFAAILTIGGLTLVVRLATVAKELVVAYKFGTGDAMDAFLTAFLLPSFAVNIIAGSFNSAVIPTFIHVREREGREASQQLFSNIIICSTCILIVTSVILAIAAPYILPIIGSGYSLEKLLLTRSLFYCLLPILVISGLSTIWGAVLNAGNKFAFVAVTPMITPLVTVLSLVAFGNIWGIYTMAFGTLGGMILEVLALAGALRYQGFSLFPRWYGMNDALKRVIKQYVPMIAGAFMMSSTGVVDQSMAAMLGPGSVASFSYGNKLVSLIFSVAALSIGTAIFPHFSRMVATDDWKGTRHTLKTYFRLILLISVPSTLLLIFFSEPIVRILFERGSFTSADTHLVGKIQALLLIQIPFYILGTLVVRLISALKKNSLLLWGAVINFVVNIGLNYFLMKFMGVAGIALSTSIVYIISFSYCWIVLNRQIKLQSCECEKGAKHING
jgi:putative peptidoglycan lipid II flippase